jgi:hypothetical protein
MLGSLTYKEIIVEAKAAWGIRGADIALAYCDRNIV